MYLHKDAKLVYLAHPRTASIATANALKKVGFEPISPTTATHHTQLDDPLSPIDYPDLGKWTVITTVRNHWDAIASHMPDLPDKGLWRVSDIESRLKNRWVKPHTLWWLHAPDANIIWRYETLQEDIAKTLIAFNVSVPELLRENGSPWKTNIPYQQLYNPKTKDYVLERFNDEIKSYNYHFDEVHT